MANFSCPKCGYDNIHMNYDPKEDMLKCNCGRCDFGFEREPIDRFTARHLAEIQKISARACKDETVIVGGTKAVE